MGYRDLRSGRLLVRQALNHKAGEILSLTKRKREASAATLPVSINSSNGRIVLFEPAARASTGDISKGFNRKEPAAWVPAISMPSTSSTLPVPSRLGI